MIRIKPTLHSHRYEQLVAFLASDRGAFISGADHIIDDVTIPNT